MEINIQKDTIMKYRFLFLFMSMCFCSCQYVTQEALNSNVRMRASIVSTGSGFVCCTVNVEGPSGNSISGAVVTVCDTANHITILQYDSTTCVYSETIEESDDTIYRFEANSILRNDIFVIEVPYTKISSKPQIIVFQDEIGNSVLNGQSLADNKSIQIAWSSSGEKINYQITIKTALKTIYSVSTNAENLFIPASIISKGIYTVEIFAQKIYGDPYFKESNFCSISSLKSAGLTFNVN
jgi:hypothetical protein